MGSSSSTFNFKVMHLLHRLKPESILDVGCGTGKWGFLFREKAELRNGVTDKKDFKMNIDGLDIDDRWLTPIHDYVYSHMIIGNVIDVAIPTNYDIVFIGDVMEHIAKDDGIKVIDRLLKLCKYLVITSPYGNNHHTNGELSKKYPYEQHISAWYPHEFDKYNILEMEITNPSFYVVLRGEIE